MSKPRPRAVGDKATAAEHKKLFLLPDVAGFTAIVCAALVVYWPCLRGGVLWDDPNYLTQPGLQNLHGLWRIWTDLSLGATGQYYPLLHTAFWIEHLIWGDALVGYHLTNVVLHSLSAFLVVLIVRRLGLPGAWLAGFLFALHPVCVESVAWITEQKNTLSTVLCLASALTYLAFDKTRSKPKYFVALGLFAAALAAKTATAPLPGILLVLMWWRRGSVSGRRDVLPLAPWMALAVGFGLVTSYVERTYIGAEGKEFALSLVQRFLVAARVPWFYAAKLVWPVDLTFFYPRWKIDSTDWRLYLFAAGLLGVMGGCVLLARRRRGPLAALLIFLGALAPVLGFLNLFYFGYSYVADHFQYLASLAIFVPAAAVLADRGRLGVWLGAALLVCLGVLTWRQSAMYTDAETLYRETLARNPDAWLAHDNLGNILLQSGRRDEAEEHFRAAIHANPDYWEAHVSLGNAFLETPGRGGAAVAEFESAVRLAPKSLRAHTDLGIGLLQAGRVAEAIGEFETALRIDPNSSAAHGDLAKAFASLPGRLPDAAEEYRMALRIRPDRAETHNDLGHVLALMPGRLPEAIAEFETAIRIQPDYSGAHTNLATAMLQIGRLPDAIAEYQLAAQFAPDSAEAHSNLGYALSRAPGREADAIAEYRRAVQIDDLNAMTHYALAGLLARTGSGEEARAEFEAAVRLKPALAEMARAGAVRK